MSTKKNLSSDVRPQEQPENSYPFAKNGLQDNVLGVMENEPGFLKCQATLPYKFNGAIVTGKWPVIFSTNGVNSAIGYYNVDTDAYTPILNDATLPFKLGFNPGYYITGEAQTNYLGEVVVAFTDKKTFPKFLNCDTPNVTALDDLRLFPLSNFPNIDITQDSGGALLPGAYYVATKYSKQDGMTTSYVALSDVSIVRGASGTLTDRALSIKLTNCDPEYDTVIVAIISRINGVTTVVELQETSINANRQANIVFTGANFSIPITLEEVLIAPAYYNKVGTMTQLNDSLYLGDLEKDPDINMQKHALLVKLEWASELIDGSMPPEEMLSGKKKGLMHEEVYSWYIDYSLTSGGYTKAFPIPGPANFGTSSDASTLANTQGITAKRYQVEDTISAFDLATKTGKFGIWINQNELYPDTDDFNATSIGGENLRNQPVRHHRTPSIRWCKENLYAFDSTYGRNKLDLLGVKATNVIIPPQYADKINGYRLLYARRTVGNSLVIGQSLLLHAARDGSYYTQGFTGPDTNYMSTAGNWHSRRDPQGIQTMPILIDHNVFRFHSFDMLFNKPAIVPTYMSMQLRVQRDNINRPLMEDYSISPGKENGPIVWLIDYLKDGNTPTAAVANKRLRAVSKTQYVPNNTVAGDWKNLQMEGVFGGKINASVLETTDITYNKYHDGKDYSYEPESWAASKEVSYLCNLMSLKTDVYLPHNAQPLVKAGTASGNASVVFFGGDVFVSDYCFHTFGWADGLNRSWNDTIGGLKAVRRFICESVSNINARYQLPGNEYSKWYPKFPLTPHEPTNYITNLDRSQEPNQFGYNKDLNALNDLLTATIFNPQVASISKFPYRTHRGGKLSRQTKNKNWRTFLPLDYYEAQKNMGFLVNLEGMDDHLLMHHENALFITQDKTRLEGGLLSVTLGSGDIFQFEPQEGLSAKLGYAGTQHDLACVRSPLGYTFIDSKQGQIFNYKGGLQPMNAELNNFFREFLKLKDRNILLGNGYTIGFDPEYKRIMLTAKNMKMSESLTGNVYYSPSYTAAFMSTLLVGDLIYDNGRWTKYLGVNATAYSCDPPVVVTLNDLTFSIPENSPIGTLIGTLSGTNAVAYYIISNSPAFTIEATTGKLKVANSAYLDFETTPTFAVTVKAFAADGVTFDTAIVTINLTNVTELPVTGNFDFNVNENSIATTLVGTVTATDPQALPLTYSITAGNSAGMFTINASTGAITVALPTLDFETVPLYVLTVTVSNGVSPVNAVVTIHVLNVNEAPTASNAVVTIPDTTVTGALIFTSVASDPDNDPLVYQLVSASVPGVFTVNPNGTVVLNANSALNAMTTPQYTLLIRALDPVIPANSVEFTLTINVIYDLATIFFEPAGGQCIDTIQVSVDPTYSDGVINSVFGFAPIVIGVPLTAGQNIGASHGGFVEDHQIQVHVTTGSQGGSLILMVNGNLIHECQSVGINETNQLHTMFLPELEINDQIILLLSTIICP